MADNLSIPAGRLGGGAANVAGALTNAGHAASIVSVVSDDEVGEQILSAAQKLGVDTGAVERADLGTNATLVLIEPDGERTLLGLSDQDRISVSKRQLIEKAFFDAMAAAWREPAFDAVFLRQQLAAYPDELATFTGPILVHGPLMGATPCDYIVVSSDDIHAAGYDPQSVYRSSARKSGGRLKGLIVTQGAEGGYAIAADTKVPFSSPSCIQVDATGAGDCFAAGFLEAITLGASLSDALTHGATWGAAAASRMGSTFPDESNVFGSFADKAPV